MNPTDAMTSGGDFFARISQILADPVFMIAAVACLMAILATSFFGGRRWLFLLLLLSLVFSSSVWTGVDTAAALLRWLALTLIALSVLKSRFSPGWGWVLFCGYVACGIACIGFAKHLVFSIQISIVLIIVALAAAALSGYASDITRMSKLCTMFIVAGTVWAVIGVASLSAIMEVKPWALRYAGAASSAPVFVATGGICLPFVVWGVMRPWRRKWRVYCGLLAMSMILCLVASAQRSGIMAGIAGCTPLLFRRNFGAAIVGCTVLGLGAAITYAVLSMSPQHLDLIVRRYTEEGLNARDVIWATALQKCMENPVLGAGHGSSEGMIRLSGTTQAYTHHGPHNAFLAAWYNTGIFGAAMLLGAVAIAMWQAFTTMLSGRSEEIKQMGALLFGVVLTLTALAMVTDSLSRPSAITTIVAALVIALVGRLVTFTEPAPAPQFWLMPVQYRATT